MGHTPGPWEIGFGPRTGRLCVQSEDTWICGQLSNGEIEPGEALANAALIAAAPELLAALEAITANHANPHLSTNLDGTDLDDAVTAIAKARGEG